MSRNAAPLGLLQQTIIMMVLPSIFTLSLLSTAYFLLQEAERLEHAKAVISTTKETAQLLYRTGLDFVQFDARTNTNTEQKVSEDLDNIPKQLTELEELVKDNAHHKKVVDTVRRETQDAVATLLINKRRVIAGGKLDIVDAIAMRKELDDCVKLLRTIIDKERSTEIDPTAAKRIRAQVNILLILGVVVMTCLLIVPLVLKRGTVSRLNVLMENSIRLGAREQLAPPIQGNDEIAQLDSAFHTAAATLNEYLRKERTTIENVADVICSLDETGVFTNMSPACLSRWGWTPEELLGKNWIELVVPEDKERSLKWMSTLRSSEAGEGKLENKLLRQDGRFIDMLWSGHWISTENSYFCVAHDFTERRELERFKQEFAAMVSHDLRTPLAAVQSTLAVLGRGAWGQLSERGMQKIAGAEANITRSIEMINTLLDLEKMELGKLELMVEQASLVQILKRCRDAVMSLAERKFIAIGLPEDDVTLMVDPDRLLQVGINLLGNAIKFSPEESNIEITYVREDHWITVRITDEGPGIPDEQQKNIFDRYHQLDGDLQAKKEGSGLGLAICKSIVEAHGGTIGVESSAGAGSTFWFRVPAGGSVIIAPDMMAEAIPRDKPFTQS